jgi:hypothetical protein
MTGTPEPGNSTPAPASGMPRDGNGIPQRAGGMPRRPLTGKPHSPCSHPPKPRSAAYDRRPAAGPGRTPPRTQRRSAEQTRQVRVELPEEPPQLTPEAALALLRILLKARAAQHQEQDRPVTGAAGAQRKG